MATKSGMNIKADPTIVGAAGNLARAMKPFDMTDMMSGFIETRGELLDSMTKNFDETLKAIDGINSELQESIEVLTTKLNNGELSTVERDELQAKILDYRTQMKNIPWGRKGRKEREDLMYAINRDINLTKERNAASLDVMSTVQSGAYDPSQLSPEYLSFMQQIATYKAEGETDANFSVSKNEKGEQIYSWSYIDENGDDQKIEGTIFDVQKKINSTVRLWVY